MRCPLNVCGPVGGGGGSLRVQRKALTVGGLLWLNSQGAAIYCDGLCLALSLSSVSSLSLSLLQHPGPDRLHCNCIMPPPPHPPTHPPCCRWGSRVHSAAAPSSVSDVCVAPAAPPPQLSSAPSGCLGTDWLTML